MCSNSVVVCQLDSSINHKTQDLGPSDLEHLEIFQFDETLNIFSYRADTSIPATIVPIGVGGQKLVA